jgi:hypothetical protein
MYRRMLTWVKPSLGLGNYFRGTRLRCTGIARPTCQYRPSQPLK